LSEKKFGDTLKPGPVAIGIDQSLTGFALTILNVDSPDNYVSWVYKSPYSGVQRLDDIGKWLTGKLDTVKDQYIQDIAMEGTVLASASALKLGELAALVKLTLWGYFEAYDHQDHLKTPLQIPPMTLKKYAAGKGNAKKQEMLMQIYKRFNIEFNDDNAADSYALARLAASIHLNATDKEIVDKVHSDPKYRDYLS
jgi:Holliday junction resolvasome RuvABC endonuclease subunit